ncbi:MULTISPECIES: conjugal transfer transcriptional regulator TraJ [Azotobacter]|uniref:Conjugal transfer relaxosome component TraJ n=1 Tax=Azotobacter chroococcum NCIMB 8003 TaxID=1328314 RepID=A0A0C4WWZ9_9GAMM|nr:MULTISPECIES: conjugal transfer transcriptional regulator TraJ [Azotobacter]AJE23497.1 Conjugal transfer relaxosome component TraJ [Azotobacter chroococcum NCIMB 8003]MDV7210082.1 conjugal transfer transcriptional regulator TraJ [Azotobacter beijerinckii]
MSEKKTTRKDIHLRVPVLPEEKAAIEDKARAAGKSVAAYMRAVGLGYEVGSVIDAELVGELSKINADQGRLGGLLKLWLTNDERFAGFDEATMRATIKAVLGKIDATQDALLELADRGLNFSG